MSWESIRLGDAATFVNGYAFKPSDWNTTGLEIIRIQNLTGSSKEVNYYLGEVPTKYLVKNGDLLISWSATLGIYEWSKEDAWLNQHIFKVVFDKEEFDKDFFRHLMGQMLDSMSRAVHGSTMKHITKKRFDNLEIPLPPLPEQKQIAAILDAADELRQKDKALIAKYDELTQSLFLDMFGDPVTNPMGWELEGFSYFATFDTKMTKDFSKYASYPHIGIANIQKGSGKLHGYKLVKDENLVSGKYIFTPDHIIYSKIRPNLNKVALPSFSGLCSADSYPILPNVKNTNRMFLAYLLRSESFVDFILTHSSRTNIPKANKKQMGLYKGIAPPVTLQNTFSELVQAIDTQKTIAQASLNKSEDLFNSLLQKAFKVELTR